MRRTKRVTITLPEPLLELVDQASADEHVSRSEEIALLLSSAMQARLQAQREARYRAAYQRVPTTDEERAWSHAAADAVLGGPDEHWQPEAADTDAAR